MPGSIVIKPSWSQLKRHLFRRYSPTLALGGLLSAIGSVAVLFQRGSNIQLVLVVLATILAIAVVTAAYNFAQLQARVSVTDSELTIIGPLRMRVVQRAEIAGLECQDVIGLLPHVMSFAIVHDHSHHALLTLNRSYWSDYSLRKLKEAIGFPPALATEVRSFRQFRREWRQ